MGEPRMRKRKPVRHKHVREVERQLGDVLGMDIDLSDGFIELAHFEGRDILLLDRTVVGIKVEIGDSHKWVPTIRGILHWKPDRCWAAVDDGATPFLLNGADCMGAGVHIADPSVDAGGFVWVRDQDRGTPLAIGVALVDGNEMMEMTKGKAISTIHWIGDELWEIEA
ncbi:MAG: PUA domain-containing protein [Candidatus Thermoplasmatota archaeon]|jgi:PUA domain protein|nr:PUA domain-containing protein [Candidatus Thermoplasmatota archaeon]